MDGADNFAFLLPVSLFCFGTAFLVAWRSGSRPSFWWAMSYMIQAAAFSAEVVLAGLPDGPRTMIVDAMFVVGFFGFAQALLIQFRLPRRIPLFVAVALSGYALVAYALFVADSLRGELLAVDLTLALLVVLPLVALGPVPAAPSWRALYAATALNAAAIAVQVVAYALLASDTASFATYMDSGYAYASQITATFFTFIFGLTALAAVTVDVVDVYREAAERDPLSGLLNRRGFEVGSPAFGPGAGVGGAIVTCDIDHFKSVNDAFGHAAGDRVIAIIAAMLRRDLPGGALAARFGGEEFVLYLPQASVGEAVVVAERARLAFSLLDLSAAGIEKRLTASFGVAAVAPGDHSLHDALARADARLYAAKLAGRNRVIASDERLAPGRAAAA